MSTAKKPTAPATAPTKPAPAAAAKTAPAPAASAKTAMPPATGAPKKSAMAPTSCVTRPAPATAATSAAPAKGAAGTSPFEAKRSSGDSSGSNRRRVVWDENNLEANEEYQRKHPVTMHIDEPKTPYVHIDDDVEAMMDSEDTKWDPQVNAYVKKVKEQAQRDQQRSGPVAPVAKNGRPMLAAGTTTGDLEREKHDREFRSMRQAVYADEGAKFKEMLAKQKAAGKDD